MKLLDRTLVWNQAHLLQILRDYEMRPTNTGRTARLDDTAPLKPLPN